MKNQPGRGRLCGPRRLAEQGLGTFLFQHLIKIAKRNGISGFTAEVLRENERMQNVFNHSGLKVSSQLEEGVYSFHMDF